jgi:hypothetical protein
MVVLMDAAGGQKKLKQLPAPEIMHNSRILTMDKYIDADEGDIEDLIGRSTYAGLLKLCYKLPRRHRLPAPDPKQGPKRLIRMVEDHFTSVGLGLGEFNRYKPAEFLAENTKKCAKKLPNLSEAMDRFEKLFTEINAC